MGSAGVPKSEKKKNHSRTAIMTRTAANHIAPPTNESLKNAVRTLAAPAQTRSLTAS